MGTPQKQQKSGCPLEGTRLEATEPQADATKTGSVCRPFPSRELAGLIIRIDTRAVFCAGVVLDSEKSLADSGEEGTEHIGKVRCSHRVSFLEPMYKSGGDHYSQVVCHALCFLAGCALLFAEADKHGFEGFTEAFPKGILPLHAECAAIESPVLVDINADIVYEVPNAMVLFCGCRIEKLHVIDIVNKIKLVAIVIVKALSVDTAAFADALYADRGEALLAHQLLHGIRQRSSHVHA